MTQESPTVQTGTRVWIEYELTTDHELIDATPEGRPLEVVMGEGQLHPVIERNFLRRRSGESFTLSLDPSLGFGDTDPNLELTIAKKKLPEAFRSLAAGDFFEAPGPDKKLRRFRVLANEGERLRVDGNHPLAGKILHLKARILKII